MHMFDFWACGNFELMNVMNICFCYNEPYLFFQHIYLGCVWFICLSFVEWLLLSHCHEVWNVDCCWIMSLNHCLAVTWTYHAQNSLDYVGFAVSKWGIMALIICWCCLSWWWCWILLHNSVQKISLVCLCCCWLMLVDVGYCMSIEAG